MYKERILNSKTEFLFCSIELEMREDLAHYMLHASDIWRLKCESYHSIVML